MAEWNKGKVLPSAINGGQEFTKKDNLAVNELNAIVNNSFYASEKSERAERLAESAVKGNGTSVTIGGQIQGEWSADFVEAERQKSKNLFNINGQRLLQGGHTFVNGNTITVEAGGSSEDDAIFGLIPVKENKTYYIGAYINNQRIQFKLYDTNKNLVKQNPSGWVYNQYWEGSYKDFETTDIITQMTIPSGVAYIAFFTAWFGGQTIISNLIVSEYSDVDNYQEWNGSITHNGDAPVVFAESERQKSKNLFFYPYKGGSSLYGVSIADNGDGSFTINGQQSSTTYNSIHFLYSFNNWTDKISPFKLSAGTYTIGVFGVGETEGFSLVVNSDDGAYYIAGIGSPRTFTIDKDTYFEIYIQVSKASVFNFDNFVVSPMLVAGTELGDYQPYNGAIVHEKCIERVEVVYDMNGGTPLDWGKTSGIYGGETVSGKDFTKYKKLIVYSYSSGNILTTIIPLRNTPSDSYIGCNAGLSNDTTDLQCIKCSVNSAKTEFEVDAMGYYNTSGFVLRNDTSSYLVFKIEGVY